MFKPFHKYTHVNAMDVVIFVLSVHYVGPNYTRLKVRWFNKRGLNLNVIQNVKITKEQYPNWSEIK